MAEPDHRRASDGEATSSEGEWRLPRLRVDADAEWYEDNVRVTHPGVLANLRDNLRRDGKGYFIQTRVRVPVTVEDVPWMVMRAEPRGQSLHVVLNDGDEADVDPGTIRMGAGAVPYCPVKGGTFEARFSRAATFQLLALADYDERTGEGTLRIGGRAWPLRRAS